MLRSVGTVFHAIHVFFEHLAAVRWEALGIALLCHLAKLAAVSRAWRNVVADAYPQARVRWRSMFGAYIAGTGVSAVVPARGGEAVKLFIAKRRIDGATYTTLASTVVLMTLFDMAVAGALVIWVATLGVLPSRKLLPHLPSFDFGWFVAHPRFSLTLVGVVLAVLLVAGIWAWRRVQEFQRRVAQGFAVLRDRSRYVRRVVAFQLLDWALRLTTVFWFLRAFNIPATVHNALLVQASSSLATIFPFSPGGIGTEQALLLYLFRGTSSRTGLLSFSVGMRVTLTIFNTLLGFAAITIMLRTLHFRRALEADEHARAKVSDPGGR